MNTLAAIIGLGVLCLFEILNLRKETIIPWQSFGYAYETWYL
jgi:hypothetical protein